MSKPDLDQLTTALHASWGSDTCYVSDAWSMDNPARGQCVVSSLVVQDYLGGDLLRYKVTAENLDETHYCNILSDGTVLDTTASQYKDPVSMTVSPIDLGAFSSARDKRLSEKETRDRYEILRDRVKYS